VSIGRWSPQNYGRSYSGRVTLRTALAKSINTVPVRLSINIGRQTVADMALRLGITTPLIVNGNPSLPLGSSEVTVLDQAIAYTAFANGGYRAHPYAVTRITTTTGDLVYEHSKAAPPPERVLDDEVVLGMVDMLHAVVENGTGRRARLPGINAAGKTGTTQAYRDAWFVGFTGNFTTAVWFGNDDYRPTNELTGGRLPAETWQKFMRVAHLNVDAKPLPGLEPPPEDDGEAAVADAEGAEDAVLSAAASVAQLPDGTAKALERLESRFRSAGPAVAVRREASLALPQQTADR
jgi:penicillin-binding protein 1A